MERRDKLTKKEIEAIRRAFSSLGVAACCEKSLMPKQAEDTLFHITELISGLLEYV